MQKYLHKARFSSFMDDLGLRLIILVLAMGWFVRLWGLTIPAALAGVALAILGVSCLSHYRRSTVKRREQALRCRLGGEMFLEELQLAPVRQTHFQTALLLGEKYSLTMERVTDDGMLCRSGDALLLVSCLALPPQEPLTHGHVLALQRSCRRWGAVRGVACTTGKVSQAVESWGAEGKVPVKVVHREELLTLAGRMCPATDAQLVELGQRKKRLAPGSLRKTVLQREKAKRYFVYGTSLLLVYAVTGLVYYPLPGLLCLLLGVCCRLKTQEEPRL